MILSLVFKNLKIILRSPFTVMLIILAPILLMLIVGVSYSNETISGIEVGMINYDDEYFSFNGINLKNYNNEDKSISQMECLSDLRQSKIDLCIDFEPVKNDDQNLISAKVTYYADNTRTRKTDILINVFNRAIDTITKEISQKTVTDIFAEIEETVVFMKEGKKTIDDVKDNLSLLLVDAKEIEQEIEAGRIDLTQIIDDIEYLRNTLELEMNSIKNSKGRITDELEIINQNFEQNKILIAKHRSDLTKFEDSLFVFAAIYPDIYDYVDLDELENINDFLGDMGESYDVSTSNIENLMEEIDNIETVDELIENADKVLENLDEARTYITLVEDNFGTYIKEVEQKEKEVDKIGMDIEDRLNYFEDLSQKSASDVTEPISKTKVDIFNNFKMIHQLAPTIVVMVLLFIGLLLSNVIVSLEVSSKAYFRNLISPVSQFKFVISLVITSLILIFFQLIFLLYILGIYFGINAIFLKFIDLLIIFSHLLIIFILLGIFMAYLFNSMQMSILVTTFVMLFMLLLSSIIVPVELMPTEIGNLVQYNPVVIGEDMIRQIFFFDTYSINYANFIPLYFYFIILVILVAFANVKRKRSLY